MDHDELPQELCDALARFSESLNKVLGSISDRELTYEVDVDDDHTDFSVQVRLNVRGIRNEGNEIEQLATALETILGRPRGVGA